MRFYIINLMKINLNKVAEAVVSEEGKKQSVNIAQVKEVLKIALNVLRSYKPSEVLELLERS